ncbi:MAG: hypothetical protein VKQ33_08790 [Candidatus Sericytochromatia bacterium]|nr:hypothetical protein [Candidatus Sericytochromatia bacterium]
MTTRPEAPACHVIDPDEVQAWPPEALEPVLTRTGEDYPTALERLAIELLGTTPAFRAARDACLASYMHPHNFPQTLDPEVEERLRVMLEAPDALDVSCFERWVPLVVRKANTLAVETWVHDHVALAAALLTA